MIVARRLGSLLDALTMGVFEHLQVTMKDKRQATTHKQQMQKGLPRPPRTKLLQIGQRKVYAV